MSRGVSKLAALLSPAIIVALAAPAFAQETLTVDFNTTVTGDDAAPGYFAPFNLWAVWIEDSGGNLVKTIGRCDSNNYMQHMLTWNAASGGRQVDTDAVSGATRANHQSPLAVTWDLTDRSGQVVPDGVYTIRLEVADENTAGAGGLPQHNNLGSFTFDKNGASSTQGPLSGGGFTDVDITYVSPNAADCGNGVIDQGETCDNAASGGDACDTSCADTGSACMPETLQGDPASCTSMCAVAPITECISGDGCCAAGCGDDDDDCTGANVSGGCNTAGGAGTGLLWLLLGLLAIHRPRYVLQSVDEVVELTGQEEEGLQKALASLRAGKGRSLDDVRATIDASLDR